MLYKLQVAKTTGLRMPCNTKIATCFIVAADSEQILGPAHPTSGMQIEVHGLLLVFVTYLIESGDIILFFTFASVLERR